MLPSMGHLTRLMAEQLRVLSATEDGVFYSAPVQVIAGTLHPMPRCLQKVAISLNSCHFAHARNSCVLLCIKVPPKSFSTGALQLLAGSQSQHFQPALWSCTLPKTPM